MGKVSKTEIAELLKQKPVIQNRITWDDQAQPQYSQNTVEESDGSSLSSINETGYKPAINRLETDCKPATNQIESDYKPTINRLETDYQDGQVLPNRLESGYKPASKPAIDVAINRLETDYKPAINWSFSALVGLEKILAEFIYKTCQISRSRVTNPLTLEYISGHLNRTKVSVKNTLQHLEKKGIVTRYKFKNGRGGWTQYELPDVIYNEILQLETDYKPAINWLESGYKVDSKPASKPAITPSSSSSLKDLKTTTTSQSELLNGWDFDISAYAKFGFTQTQIKQLAPLEVISAQDVEQSLIQFAYDLENDKLPPIKTSKLNFLMGLLRSGSKYVSEGYRNQQDAMILEMARRGRAKQESLLNAQYEAWAAALTDEQKINVENKMPTHLIVLYRTYGVNNAEIRKWLFDYYLAEYSNRN